MKKNTKEATGPETAIVVLNWNNAADTLECLQSIFDCSFSRFPHVILCDNGSSDGSEARIRCWAARHEISVLERLQHSPSDSRETDIATARDSIDVRRAFTFIQTGSNLGFAGGNNIGIRCAIEETNAEYLLLLNNDAVLTEGALEKMAECFSAPSVGMAGCTVAYFHSPNVVQARGGARYVPWRGRACHVGAGEPVVRGAPNTADEHLDYILGAALMVSRRFVLDVGMLACDYFLYFEEIDWATRGKAAGYKLAYAPDALIFHKEGGSIGSSHKAGSRSQVSEYYLARSRVIFTARYYPRYLVPVYLSSMLEAIKRLARGNFRSCLTILGALHGARPPAPVIEKKT